MRVNFGPSFIKRPEIVGVNAVSELQPMNPEDRKVNSSFSQPIVLFRFFIVVLFLRAHSNCHLINYF